MSNPNKVMAMSQYEKLVLILPDEAAERLKQAAAQESQTVAGFVAGVVENWLEKRRRDVRLGRTKQTNSLSHVQKVSTSGNRE